MMMRAWGITDKGSVRPQNQDDFYVDVPGEDLALCVVCDGMGGAKAGNIASKLAVDTFVDSLRQWTGESDGGLPKEPVMAAAELANRAVYHRAASDADCLGMGTTLVAALVQEDTAHIINIGDSRCYFVTGEGISKLTRDHSIVEDMVVRGELSPEAARNHPRKNLITRALGAEEHIRADFYTQQVNRGDYLLLCSDGLSNMVTDQEMLYEILHGGTAENCCRRLLDIALSRGAPDNVTVVLLQV